jgi:alginate O-acetyltransferase complex protein AlgI
MSFTEVEIGFFLVPAVALYWFLPRSRLVQNVYLVVLSLIFYATWNWRLFWVLLGGVLIDYFVMRRLDAQKAVNGARRATLAISLTYGLGTLAFFKYERFFAESFNGLGLGIPIPVLHTLLPLGLSFYTLQRIGLVLDVYWDRYKAPQSFLDFLLFSSFFPQLTAGPISRGHELLPQLGEPRTPQAKFFADGASSFLLGYILKGWAADVIGSTWVDPVFAHPSDFNRTSHLLATIGYPLQVFADFAGYSLMAIGVALFFGIQLPTNFDNPFLSRSLPELWRRWHITLNRWLFDYIFTPLTTSRGWFRGRLDAALLVTFLASGLWHGAAWTFIIWGLFHGLGMVAQRNWDEYYRKLCRKDRKFVARRKSSVYQILAWFLTVAFFAFTLVAFRASSMHNYFDMLLGLASREGTQAVPIGVSGAMAASFAIAGLHILGIKGVTVWRDRFFALPPIVRGLVYGFVVVFLMIRVPVSAGAFIYQQF